MKIAYVDEVPSEHWLKIIGVANVILDRYKEQGFVLTLRQLYYRFVTEGLLENVRGNYDKLGTAGQRVAWLG